MDERREFRFSVLKRFGADGAAASRLLEYNDRLFSCENSRIQFPVKDERFVALWRRYAEEVERENTIECLSRYLVQFRFPVAEDMSRSHDYQAATRFGARFQQGSSRPFALDLLDPKGVRLWVHSTPAGSIPVLLASNRPDFVTLLRALLYRNEPVPVSGDLGAYIVSGFRNWHRYYHEPTSKDANRQTDRFIILSSGPYSGISAEAMEMSEPSWNDMSVRIRLEHESTHYFTRRLFGSMANNVYDEIVADYRGIVSVSGSYRAAWALRFLGIDSDGGETVGGRLNRYLPDDLPVSAVSCLRLLAARAISNLAKFDSEMPWTRSAASAPLVISSLASLSLEELACDRGADLVADNLLSQSSDERRTLCEKRYTFSAL